MIEYSFEEMKERLISLADQGFEPELKLYLFDKEYMIIVYADQCSFQRCGSKLLRSGEFYYSSLDELYHSETVDHILLERDWEKISDWDCFEFAFLENE